MWIVPFALAVCAVASLIAGIWLVIHLPAVMRVFGRHADIVPPRGRRRVPPHKVLLMLVIFNAGWIAAVVIWVWVIGGDANQVTIANP